MSPKLVNKQEAVRSDRWEEKLAVLARSRGDGEAVATRAIQLSRQLSLSPWIALGIAERLISMKDARILDQVGRCKELQTAILDKHRTIEELRVMMPYAAHFLAVELMEVLKHESGDIRVVIRILESVLNAERNSDDESLTMLVRTRTNNEYAAIVRKILGIIRRTRCDVRMALEVDAGHVTEQFAADHIRQRRRLAMEEYQDNAPQAAPGRDHWPKG
ncbi:MAG: hypothetical protein WCI03_10160 [bacterium]